MIEIVSGNAFIAPLLEAVAHQRAGRLDEAYAGFHQVLDLEPEQPQALLFAGVIATQTRRFEQALSLLRRAAEVRPGNAETLFALGNAHWAAGDGAAAVQAWLEVIARQPNHVGSLLNLAQARERDGDAAAAIATCRAAVAVAPGTPLPLAALASALRAAGRLEESLAAAEQAVACGPALAITHHQRGTTLAALRRAREAVDALREAVRLAPGNADSLLNLANALGDLGDAEGALYHCRAAIEARPGMAEAFATLGHLLTDYGTIEEAVTACREAIALAPDFAHAHSNLGIALLSGGDLRGGFAEYEWRKRHRGSEHLFRRLETEEWRGGPLEGKHLMVLGEQGLGDAIMFSRYAALLAARGARVTLAVDRRLVRLLGTAPGAEAAIPNQVELPAHDLWVDQMSLPHLFDTTLETIPCPDPYLAADAGLAARWRERLGPLPAGRRRVGLAWAGNPKHTNDHNRSSPIDTFLPIARHPAVRAVSLQVGPRAGEALQLGLRDWSAALTDYAETAALIDALDLVITVDTSVAHLAAAMGKPTWILLPYRAEWRWLRGREDTPWYRCVRLLRQPARQDWTGLREAVLEALTRGLEGLSPPQEETLQQSEQERHAQAEG